MTKKTPHEYGHEFMDWVRTIQPVWKGKQKESWISFEEYARARFRDWAISTKELPLDQWDEVFKEYMED